MRQPGWRLASRAVELGKDDPNVLWMSAFAIRALGADARRARETPRSLTAIESEFRDCPDNGRLERGRCSAIRRRPWSCCSAPERLSPRDPRAWYMASAAALTHFAAGRFEEAVACAKRALAQNPRFTRTLRVLAASLAKLGREEAAKQVMQDLLKN